MRNNRVYVMETQIIPDIFKGIPEKWKIIIARQLKNELASAFKQLFEQDGAINNLCPPIDMIFHAFRLCPPGDVKVIILGQDPYIGPGEAMGMAFSVNKGKKIPPSLRGIYNCLERMGIRPPVHGDLTAWAKQGVLLINTAFTTILGRSNAHTKIWEDYSNKLIQSISAELPSTAFILLGNYARDRRRLIDTTKHVVFEWGHPSPLNQANKSDNPANIKYCDCFIRANEWLKSRGRIPINWDPDVNVNVNTNTNVNVNTNVNANTNMNLSGSNGPKLVSAGPLDPAPLTDCTFIFTDGGSQANGGVACNASWAYYITDGCNVTSASGIVPQVPIEGEVYKSSNNRGELTAAANAIAFVRANQDQFGNKFVLVSDSEYTIGCINVWINNWLADRSKLKDKKNLDIIVPAKENLDHIRQTAEFTFRHVRSHLNEPQDKESEEWFLWKGNDIVDRLCNKTLGRN